MTISNNMKKHIHTIKQTLAPLSNNNYYRDDVIHTTLKECNMDYKETCRRLKMIHDVREIAGKHSVDDVYVMLKECNLDPNEAAQRLLYIDTFHEVKKKTDRRKSTSSDEFEEYGRGRGYQWRGPRNGERGNFYPSKDAGGGRNVNSRKEYVAVNNHVERVSKQTLPVDSGKQNGHMGPSAAKTNGTPPISNGSLSPKPAPKVPSYSEAVSYQNTKYTCSVGAIKCEIVKREGCSRQNGSTPGSKKFSSDQAGAGINPVIAEAASDVVVENQIPESLLSTQNSSHVVIPAQENQPAKATVSEQIPESLLLTQNSSHAVIPTQENQPAKATVSEHTTAPIIDTYPTSEEDSELKLSSPNLDAMLEKLTVSSPVIFPDHLQVPEKYKNQFVFGSLDTASDDSEPISDDSKAISVIESTHHNGDVVTEPSLSDQNVPTAAQEVEHEDQQLPNLSDHVLPSPENISSDPALKHEQTEQEMGPAIGGFQNLVFPTTRDYSYGFIPHPMSPHFVQLDVPELQNVSSQVASTLVPTSAAQPAMAGQTSMAMSPPQFPYYRQPYPAYIPYNPYYHPMYFAHNAQLLNHGVFPQQPPLVNVHMQPGVKLPAPPSQYKQESNEDLNSSQANDTNVHSTAQQGEGLQVRAPAAGVEVPSLPPHYFYFPQAQHMAFSPLQAGPYHSSQTMTSQPTLQPPLAYQIQPTSGTIEPVIQPPNSYQQAQPALLNRETN